MASRAVTFGWKRTCEEFLWLANVSQLSLTNRLLKKVPQSTSEYKIGSTRMNRKSAYAHLPGWRVYSNLRHKILPYGCLGSFEEDEVQLPRRTKSSKLPISLIRAKDVFISCSRQRSGESLHSLDGKCMTNHTTQD